MKRKDKAGIVLRAGEYQRATNGTYEYKYKDTDGRRRSVSAGSLAALRKIEQRIERDRMDGIRAAADITIHDLYSKWVNLKKGRVKSNTLSDYCYMYNRFIEPQLGNVAVKNLKKSDVQLYYNNLTRDNLQASTLRTVHNILHQLLDIAVNDEIVRHNAATGALQPFSRELSAAQHSRKALTLEEQRRLLSYMQAVHSRWYNMIALTLYTGLRIGELIALQWQNINFQERELTVEHNIVYYTLFGVQQMELHDAKTDAGRRVIPLSDDALAVLKGQQEASEASTGYVFTNRNNKPHLPHNVNRALHRVIAACNAAATDDDPIVSDISWHCLRHSFCTNLCRAGIDIRTIMEIMGHTDSATTLEIYADCTRDMQQSAAVKLRNYMADGDK